MRAGASEQDILAAAAAAPRQLPEDYRSFLRVSNVVRVGDSFTAFLAWISRTPRNVGVERAATARPTLGNLALAAFVCAFDENNNHARDEHP
jgi:hypothetical protein